MILLSVLFLLAGAASAPSGAPIALSAEHLHAVNRGMTVVGNEVYLDAAEGTGFAWIDGLSIEEGCLALEVKGNADVGRSFVGLAFRAVDQETYDSVYVRPFVFRSDNPAVAANGVQYMSMPDFGWPVLRQKSPGVYEKPVTSRPDPLSWVPLKVRFGGGRLQAYVDGSAVPQLDLPLLTARNAGRVALWVGNNSSGGFRNLHRCQ